GWQAEWETVPEIFLLTSGALSPMRMIIAGLWVDAERMRANLEATRGMIYAESVSTALARAIGHAPAHRLVERACRNAVEKSRPLQEVVLGDPLVPCLQNELLHEALKKAEVEVTFQKFPGTGHGGREFGTDKTQA